MNKAYVSPNIHICIKRNIKTYRISNYANQNENNASSLKPTFSSLTSIKVRKDVAMTGEITLRGRILPIGGLKEKLLAAHRAGIKEVIIPKDNEKDLVDIPKKVKDDIKIIPVEYADEAIRLGLTKELKLIEWTEVEDLSKSKKEDKTQASIQ